MAIKVTEAKKGMVINYEGELYQIMKYEHVTPGNWRAINHLTLKNLRSGRQKEVRMNSGEMIEPVFLERKECQYLYRDSTGHVFMDTDNYEQFTLPADLLADSMSYITENSTVGVVFNGTEPITVELPSTVVLEIAEAEEAVKGNSVSNLTKSAKLVTGLALKVPFHIKKGDMVKVSTETGEFMGRANE